MPVGAGRLGFSRHMGAMKAQPASARTGMVQGITYRARGTQASVRMGLICRWGGSSALVGTEGLETLVAWANNGVHLVGGVYGYNISDFSSVKARDDGQKSGRAVGGIRPQPVWAQVFPVDRGWTLDAGHQGAATVKGAAHAPAAAVEDMGVDHRGFDIAVSEQFLDGAEVVTDAA